MLTVNKELLESLYIEMKKSIPMIAHELGISQSTVRNRLLYYGIPLRRRLEAIRIAAAEGRLSPRGRVRKPMSAEARQRIREARLRYGEEKAVGVTLKPNGYVEYTRGPHKGRSVHDVLMEQMIGRPLAKNEIVHHINGKRDDNRPENLALMTRSEHSRAHVMERLASGEDIRHFESKKGEEHPSAKLTEAQVIAIRASSNTSTFLATLYGVSKSTIKHIKSRRIWKHI